MARNRRKISLKKILCLILVGIVAVTVIGGVAAFAKKDTETISWTKFSRGGLDENGEHVASEQTLYTEEAFGCRGLKVVPEFDAHLTYDVYYYNDLDELVDKRLGIKNTHAEEYPQATKCRIVIHPETSEKDFKIAFYEVAKYAKKLKITVDKKQEFRYESFNLFDKTKVTEGKTFASSLIYTDWNSNTLTDWTIGVAGSVNVTEKIKVDGSYDNYDVYVYLEANETEWPTVAIFNADGSVNDYVNLDAMSVTKPVWVKLTIEVPELDSYEGVHLMVHLPDCSTSTPETICYIFGYND